MGAPRPGDGGKVDKSMAMRKEPYVVMRKKLGRDPRVLAAASKLQRAYEGKPIPPSLWKAAILGGLFQLWCLGDEYGEFLSGVSQEIVDAECAVQGFCESLPPDWISQKKGGVKLPHYQEHNGPGAKARILGAARVSKHRDAQRNATCNATCNGSEMANGPPRPDHPSPTQNNPERKPPPPTLQDARALDGYAREVVGLSVKDLVGKAVEKVLVDFGQAGVVELLEHLASRRPSERFEGARSVVAVCRSLLNQAADGPLKREHDYEPFARWLARREAEVAAVGVPGRARP